MNEILWVITRASGLVSAVLLTTTLVLGMLTSARAASSPLSRAVITAVHRTLSLVMVAFIAVHVITAVAETYVDISWLSVIVPFTSGYERLWVGLGTLAVDIALAVVITSLFRHRIPERAWRLVHLSAYAMWPIALLHGVESVTTDTLIAYVVTAVCAVAGLTALGIRLVRRPADDRRRPLAPVRDWKVGASS